MNKRLAITAKDIAIVTGKHVSSSYRLINSIKDALNKKPHQILTLREFCNYEGLELSEVYEIIK
jgi:hypothetical protein